MNTLHLRSWTLRLASVAAGVLAVGCFAIPAAYASPGDLSFVGCTGLLPDCTSTNPVDALTGAAAVAVTPDGMNMYVASQTTFAISHFTLDLAGNTTYAGCTGEHPGCTPISPLVPLASVSALAVSPDGKHLFVTHFQYPSTLGSGVSEFTIDAAGNLTFDGCYGYPSGCTPFGTGQELDDADAVAVTRDGKNLYVASLSGSISHFIIGPDNNLIYSGCIGNGTKGCSEDTNSGLTPSGLAVTPDGKNLYASSYNGMVTHFGIDTAGNLTYADCNGNSAGCTPISPGGALSLARGVLVSPDGRNVYASAAHAVTHFRLGGTGSLYFAGCTGDVTGCHATTPVAALDGFNAALATTYDGAHLYVTSNQGSEVSRFGVDSAGNLNYLGCTGELTGCGGTTVIHALDGADGLAVAPNDAHLYVAGGSGNDVSDFTIAGFSSLACPATPG
ncbi:MAG TPA: hypothetical protein VKU39_11995 [Streptosporangiaceae bacterium]|nr:hypothetical protein [Streptosporangiaceae bacterium]